MHDLSPSASLQSLNSDEQSFLSSMCNKAHMSVAPALLKLTGKNELQIHIHL